jgi:uncharacterized membrane protein YoaK (UPF0700 family)
MPNPAGPPARPPEGIPVTRNSRQILVMSIAAILGGVLGFVIGQFVLNPTILIPIGVIIGIAVSLPVAQKKV